MAVASGTREHRHPGRHFLVRASEAELICGAIRQLASGPLAEATIAALRAAGREAQAGGPGGTFFFEAPEHSEHLVIRAAIKVNSHLLVRP
jgi:hypothetical protein